MAPTVIEFVGAPGAGKTTLAGIAVDLLRAGGVTATTPIGAARRGAARSRLGGTIASVAPAPVAQRLLWWLFYVQASIDGIHAVRERRELWVAVRRSQRARPITARRRRHIDYWFFQLLGRRRLLDRRLEAGTTLVVDDGFAHRALALTTSHRERSSEAVVASYLDRVPSPDILVVLEADPEVCTRRVLERGVWNHARDLTIAEVGAYVRNAAAAVDLVGGRARQIGWQVVTIASTDRSLEQVRDDLARALLPLTVEATR